jgi:OmcA/MtrC family decaheme c-type cytochrome
MAIEVVDVIIPADLRPEVIFELTDSKGNPIGLGELTEARFLLAYLDEAAPGDTAHYVSYTTATEDPDRVPNSGDEATQATYDAARLTGISRNSDGTYTYKFTSAVPADYDPTKSHQLAGQFRRTFIVDGKAYPYNLAHAFVPAGDDLPVDTREIVATETCNNCHTRLSVHGDIRREVQLCIVCHTSQTSDAQSGNSMDFATMIHKIHRGADLPSVQAGEPYRIVGFGGSVHDYSEVELPQDIRNCAMCHTGAPQSDYHLTKPTLNGCASCHDRTWFGNPDAVPATYAMHTGGEQVDNSLCAVCHKPEGPAPAPITEAHIRPTQSDAAPGLAFDILDVETTPVEGGHRVAVTFEATDKNGARYTSLTSLTRGTILIAYPADEYETYLREAVIGNVPGTVVSNPDGTFTYTFAALLPDASFSFAAAMEGRVTFQYRGENVNQGTSDSGEFVFTLDGSEPVQRRVVVENEKCNKCHDDLRAHGGSRVGVDYCVKCHNTGLTAESEDPNGNGFVTVNFKDMIHAIHSGSNLESGYTVGDTDFTEVVFPGRVQECSICHADGSVDLPLPEEALPTVVRNEEDVVLSSELPTSSACTSCHDGLMANIHAVLQTDPVSGVESCTVCHGPNSGAAVRAVHALAP